MNKLPFNGKKATEFAVAFIEKSNEITYLMLITLMYLADREALIQWGRPISGDEYFSLLKNVYSTIKWSKYWSEYIEKSAKYTVALSKPCLRDDLSEAEENLIDEVFTEYGHWNQWKLVEHLHNTLPEWKGSDKYSLPILTQDIILKAGGIPQNEVAQIKDELENLSLAKSLFGCD